MSAKETVGTFLGAVLKGGITTMREPTNTDYIQHNPFIPTGLEPFIEMLPVLQNLTSQNNMFKYTKIHKVLGEGNFVLTVSEGEWNGKQQVFYDLLRFDNGKAVEHWDV